MVNSIVVLNSFNEPSMVVFEIYFETLLEVLERGFMT